MQNSKTSNSRFIALSYPDFAYLWVGLLISNMGSQMQIVALNWHIYVLTHSAIALGLIGLARFIPIIFFSLIGGSLADVYNRKKIMFSAQIALTIFSLVLTIMTLNNTINSLMIYLITVASAVAMSFDMPSRQSFIPRLVDRKHLTNAISLNSIMFQTSTIIGPSLAGFAIAKYGVGFVYAFNTLSFLAVIAALIMIKTSGAVTNVTQKVSFSSVKEGLLFVKSKPLIWSTMLLDFFSTFFSSATALLPIYAKDILRVGPQGLGFLYASPAIGSIGAAFTIAHVGHLRKQGKILLVSFALYGLATIIFGFSKFYLLSLFALILAGYADGISMIIRNTIRQMQTPDHVRGRMVAITMIFFLGGPQLGEFEAGLVAAWFNAPISVISGGIATVIIVFLATTTLSFLRNYGGEDQITAV